MTNQAPVKKTDSRGRDLKKKIVKAMGIKASDISVRIEKYSMGESFHITVKTIISMEKVEQVAKGNEKVDRDADGDILAGGNTFIFVGYSLELADKDIQKIIEVAGQLGDDSDRDSIVRFVAAELVKEDYFKSFTDQDYRNIFRQLPTAIFFAVFKD